MSEQLELTQVQELLKRFEALRTRRNYAGEPADYIFRLCQAELAEVFGYRSRAEWTSELNNE